MRVWGQLLLPRESEEMQTGGATIDAVTTEEVTRHLHRNHSPVNRVVPGRRTVPESSPEWQQGGAASVLV